MSTISFAEALKGVVESDWVEALDHLVREHKNWGAFTARVPSHVVVLLVDEIKRLKEQEVKLPTSLEYPVVGDLDETDED